MSSLADNDSAKPTRQHYGLTFLVLALGTSAYSVLQASVTPALPVIQDELNASTTSVAWVFTGYLLSASILTPIGGRLGDMFGKERLLMVSLAVLCVGVLIAALANSIGVLIFARVIQGASGAIFPLSYGIIRDEFPREKAAQGIALISAILGIGGGLGIVLAGPIITTFDYHFLFWFPFAVALIATVATFFFVPESPVKSPGRVDVKGALLLSVWLVLLLLGITQTSQWGWGDLRVWALLVAAAAMLVVWIRVEDRIREPLIDMKMMRIRGVWTVNAAAFLVGAGMYTSFILVPEFTETPVSAGYGFGASVTGAGLFLLPATVALVLVTPVAGWLTDKIGARVILIAGCIVATIAFLLLAFSHDQRSHIYFATALMGIGIGFAFSSLANLIVEAVPPSQTGVATGMNTVMRTLGGAVGAQIGASLIAGTVVASALPTENGFKLAFLLAAAASTFALLASLLVPRRAGPAFEIGGPIPATAAE